MRADNPIAVIQCGDGLENRHRILPMALSLKDAGWTPAVLVNRFERGGALFLAHGIGIIPMSNLRVPAHYRPGFKPTLNQLCPLEMQRTSASGGRLHVQKHRDIFRSYSYVLDQIQPGMICVWNGYTGAAANALRCYKNHYGLPGGFMERGLAGNSVFFDPDGVNGYSTLARGEVEFGTAPNFPSTHLKKYHEMVETLAQRSMPRILVPLQVQDDSNILLFGNRILKMRDLVLYAVKLAQELGEEWKVVVRPHPEERPSMRLNLPIHERIEIDENSSLEEAISSTSLCLTINSMVGLEAALMSATTICLGEGIYCRQPFVIQGQDRNVAEVAADARDHLANPHSYAAEKSAFLYRVQSHHQVAYARGSTASGRLEEWRVSARSAPRRPHSETYHRFKRKPRPDLEILYHSRTMPRVWRKIQEIHGGPPLDVHVFLQPDDRLFLTYRKISERITRSYLMNLLKERNIPVASLSRSETPQPDKAKIAILHSKSNLDLSEYDIVLDEYGYPHVNTYCMSNTSSMNVLAPGNAVDKLIINILGLINRSFNRPKKIGRHQTTTSRN